MYMYVYTYIHTYIHTYIRIIHTYIRIYIHTYDTYIHIGPQLGFAVVGDSALAAQDYLGWVAEARDLALGDTVDLLFIDTRFRV